MLDNRKYIVFILKDNKHIGYVASDRLNLEFQAMEAGRFSVKEAPEIVKEWTKEPSQQAYSMQIWDTYDGKSLRSVVKNGKRYISIFA